MAEVATNGSTAAEAAAVVFTGLKVQVIVEAGRAEEAVAFYKTAFAAEEVSRSTHPKRKGDGGGQEPALLRAELRICGAALLVAELAGGDDVPALVAGAGGAAVLRLVTDDLKGAAAQVAGAGATLRGEIGEDDDGLCATFVDPFGVTWVLASASSAKKCA